MQLDLLLLAAEKFWILDPLYYALGTLLAWFYALIPSYGVAIVLLTVAVRIVTLPLTAKQARSQQELQRLQPELKRLQAKYKNDRQKLNEEMMKFYKEHKVNPFGGCLPLLIQMPILIVLYRLILGLSAKPPKNVPKSSELYRNLVESGGQMLSWGMDLAKSASTVKGADQVPYLFLIALVVATGYFQQRQLSARLPKDGANSQMQMLGKIFPVFFGIISFTIPAGVVVYFAASNLWQIGQQAVLFRNQSIPESPPPDDKKAERTKKGLTGPKEPGAGGGKQSELKPKRPSPNGGRHTPRNGAAGKSTRGKNARGPGRTGPGPNDARRKGSRGKNDPRKDSD